MRNLFRWRFVNFSILMDKISTFGIVKGLIMKLWFLDPAARWKCKERVRGEKKQLLSRGFKFETQKKVIEKTSSLLGLRRKLLLFLRDLEDLSFFSTAVDTFWERQKNINKKAFTLSRKLKRRRKKLYCLPLHPLLSQGYFSPLFSLVYHLFQYFCPC